MRRLVMALAALTLVAPLPPALSAQDDPAVFYEDNCASCHSIGEGVIGGPDLKGVTARRDRAWLIQFLLKPEAFASDPVVKRMIDEADGAEMETTEGLTPELAEALLQLIEQRSGVAAAPARPERPVTATDVELGRAIFMGRTKLTASGAPCIACHAAGDVRPPVAGRLGADLAQVHDRLRGRRGVNAWLGSPPTPMMRALYRPAPLTADEAHALSAFLELPVDQATAGAPALPPFVLAGTAGGLLFVGLIGGVWTRRFRSVRRPLVARAHHWHPGPRHAPGAGGSR
jgi:mono/diheme cytochrome c family protein